MAEALSRALASDAARAERVAELEADLKEARRVLGRVREELRMLRDTTPCWEKPDA